MVGFAAALYGYQYWFSPALLDLDSFTNTIGLDLKRVINYADYMIIAFIVADSLVCLYGWREKFRICFNKCLHCNHCVCWFLKISFKGIINLIVLLAMALTLICMVAFEGIYVLFWTVSEVCNVAEVIFVVSSQYFCFSLK